jgi:hypothetical protein
MHEMFACMVIQRLEDTLHVSDMEFEDCIQDFASLWRKPDTDRSTVFEITHPLEQTFGLHVVISSDMAHACATLQGHSADFLIEEAPGLARFGYFKLVERLRSGEATLEDLLASQDLYDNHFLDSPVWRAARE